MKITNKPAMLGKSLKGHNIHSRPADGDEEGDAGEPVAGKEVRLTGTVLTKKQFDFLTGDDAWRRNFDDSEKPAKWLNNFRKIVVPESYTDCAATIKFGVSDKEIELKDAVRIKNIVIKITKADVPTMDCTLQAQFPRKLETLDLEAFYGKEVTLAVLKFGAVDDEREDKQGELGLANTHDGDGADKPIDKTRVLAPGQAEREAETERQLSEALRGLEKQDAEAEEKSKNGRRRSTEPRVN